METTSKMSIFLEIYNSQILNIQTITGKEYPVGKTTQISSSKILETISKMSIFLEIYNSQILNIQTINGKEYIHSNIAISEY